MINYPTDLQKFLISVSSFGNNLSGFLQAFPVVRVSLESVTSTEPGKSSGRFQDRLVLGWHFFIPHETVTPLGPDRCYFLCANRVYHKKARMTLG